MGLSGLSIGIAPIPNAHDLNCLSEALAEYDPPVTDPKAVLWRIETVQLFDIAAVCLKGTGPSHREVA
jgi:hypothetical protein